MIVGIRNFKSPATYGAIKMDDSGEFTAIDLFCGAGGLSKGFERAGFSIAAAIDNDPDVAETYEHNHGFRPLICDISGPAVAEKLKDQLSNRNCSVNDVDAVIGGPPCKGFSQANVRRSTDHPLNGLPKRFLDLVEEFDPQAVVMENVPNILRMSDGSFKADILDELRNLGYNAKVEKLNAEKFGVPQARRRVFFVGVKKGHPPFPSHNLTDADYVPVKNAIFDLPELPTGGGGKHKMAYDPKESDDYIKITSKKYINEMRSGASPNVIYNHKSTVNREKTYERFKHVPQGGNWRDIPAELMDNYNNREQTHDHIYQRLEEDSLAKTVANFRKQMIIHPTQDRLLTIREAARLQSFSDDYRFINDSICVKQQMVGNAVPVKLAESVGRSVITYLRTQASPEHHVRQ